MLAKQKMLFYTTIRGPHKQFLRTTRGPRIWLSEPLTDKKWESIKNQSSFDKKGGTSHIFKDQRRKKSFQTKFHWKWIKGSKKRERERNLAHSWDEFRRNQFRKVVNLKPEKLFLSFTLGFKIVNCWEVVVVFVAVIF